MYFYYLHQIFSMNPTVYMFRSLLFASVFFFFNTTYTCAQIQGRGGPDLYGYTWRDSYDSVGPLYSWVDITSSGTQVLGLADDNVIGPFAIPNEFQYYWYFPKLVWIGSNGYITFNSDNIASPFPVIPNAGGAHNFIAALMCDLNFAGAGNTGSCYYYATPDSLVFSWINVPFWTSGLPYYTGQNSFQIVMNRVDKSITFNYKRQIGLTLGNDITIGIENINGAIGLQHSKNVYPDTNYSVRFYYPDTVTYQVTDAGIDWNQSPFNQATFTLIQRPCPLTSYVKNYGNQPLGNFSIRSSVSSFNLTTPQRDTVAIASLPVAVDTVVNFDPLTPLAAGIYDMQTDLAGITNDMVAFNNQIRTKIVAIDTAQTDVPLDYSDGVPDGFGISWSSGNAGMGYYMLPPFFPYRITQYRLIITGDPTLQGCFLKIYADDGPNGGPGTLLDSTWADPASTPPGFLSLVPLSTPVTRNAGGFYVLWEMPAGSNISLARDLTQPISCRTMEVIQGAWAGYRSRLTEDMVLGVLARPLRNIDLAVDPPVFPLAGAVVNAPIRPRLRIRGVGTYPHGTATVSYRFGNQPIVTETLPAGSPTPGGSFVYEFTTPLSSATSLGANLCLWVRQTDDVNRANDSTCIPLNFFLTGIEEQAAGSLIKIYPNPSDGQRVFIETTDLGKIDDVRVLDATGRLVAKISGFSSEEGRYEFDVESWSRGLYTIRVQGERGVATARLIHR